MTKPQCLWLNRCIVIIVLLLSNLGAIETDAQESPPASSRASLSSPLSDVSTFASQASSQYKNDLYSYNISTMHLSPSPISILEMQIEPQGIDVPSRDFSDPNLYSAAMSASLEIEHCSTPLSLMLHSSFGVQRMHQLADQIERANLETMTYRGILDYLLQGRCPPENAIIVSIDDLGSNWLRNDFIEMIRVFTDRDLVLVVGLIVHGPQDPEIWQYLRELDEIGIEVASHTIDHYNLPQLTYQAIQRQIIGSYVAICEHLGKCPVTLILPFGNIDTDGSIIEIANEYTFVVGIQGGRTFSGKPPWYLGRSPPHDTNQSKTIYLLEKYFQSEPVSY